MPTAAVRMGVGDGPRHATKLTSTTGDPAARLFRAAAPGEPDDSPKRYDHTAGPPSLVTVDGGVSHCHNTTSAVVVGRSSLASSWFAAATLTVATPAAWARSTAFFSHDGHDGGATTAMRTPSKFLASSAYFHH
jgi:hypothetical protein